MERAWKPGMTPKDFIRNNCDKLDNYYDLDVLSLDEFIEWKNKYVLGVMEMLYKKYLESF